MKIRKKNDIELTIDEQNGRMQIILSGIASILLVNITAAVIIVSFHWSVFGDVKFKSIKYVQTQQKGTVLFGTYGICFNATLRFYFSKLVFG